MNLDPINLARFNGSWEARCTPPAARNYLLEQIDTARRPPTRLRSEDLKQMTILWAAATFIMTFIFVKMTVYASAATISVPAAACGSLYTGAPNRCTLLGKSTLLGSLKPRLYRHFSKRHCTSLKIVPK